MLIVINVVLGCFIRLVDLVGGVRYFVVSDCGSCVGCLFVVLGLLM